MQAVNDGTEEQPVIREVFTDLTVECAEERLETVLSIVKTKAYGEITVEDIPDEEREPTTDERVAALEEENALLKAQMDFYEDCIAEMAMVVYA